MVCAQDKSPDVRQSAFALSGDLARNCYEQLKPIVPILIPILAINI